MAFAKRKVMKMPQRKVSPYSTQFISAIPSKTQDGEGSNVTGSDSMKMLSPREKEIRSLYENVRPVLDEHDSDLIIYAGKLNKAGFNKLSYQFEISKKKRSSKNVLLFLHTSGGDAHIAYKIVSLFHEEYERFFLYVPQTCKSAGTMVALGAHTLIMANGAELGPLDAQLPGFHTLGGHDSCLLQELALETIASHGRHIFNEFVINLFNSSECMSFEVASETATKITTGSLECLYKKIDPEKVAIAIRSKHIATEYGSRLAAMSGNVAEGAITKLIEDFPSHGFAIINTEATKFFHDVVKPSTSLTYFTREIMESLVEPTEEDSPLVDVVSADLLSDFERRRGDFDSTAEK